MKDVAPQSPQSRRQSPKQHAKRQAKGYGFLLGLLILLGVGGLLWWNAANAERAAVVAFDGASKARPFWDASFVPTALPGSIAPYPGLAPQSKASIHGDGYQSDVHPFAAPIGESLTIRSRKAGGLLPRQCSTMTFRRDGLMVAMCGGVSGFRMVLIDPDSLRALAWHDLAMRPSAFQALIKRDVSINFEDSSGGAYFVLDDQDRVIVGDPNQQIKRLIAEKQGRAWHFRVEKLWNMKPHVPSDCLHYDNWFPSGECDAITTVVPGPQGLYWWTTRYGRLGTLDPRSGKVAALQLEGEEIQNALAVDTSAVYVLSDHAQYAFRTGEDQKPEQIWRHEYDRGTSRKKGAINQGSGTTPTLLGADYLTIADNADGRINLLVLRRGKLAEGQERQICTVPLFKNGKSTAENSMIGWERSIIIENNHGYTNGLEHRDWRAIAAGVSRIDVREDESGCDEIWTSDLVVPSVVPKLSLKTGIAYFYSFDLDSEGVPDWLIVGLDFKSGAVVQKIPTGKGFDWNNNWSSLAIGSDGSLYAGTIRGLLQVRQSNTTPEALGETAGATEASSAE